MQHLEGEEEGDSGGREGWRGGSCEHQALQDDDVTSNIAVESLRQQTASR